MTTRESLELAELAYQQAPRATSEPARMARLAAVRQAVADGWTHAAIAEAMGKSRGWVGQRATVAPKLAAVSDTVTIEIGTAEHERYKRIARGGAPGARADDGTAVQHPAGTSSRAIDRFRRTET